MSPRSWALAVCAVCVCVIFSAVSYGKYLQERKRAEAAEHSLSVANATIRDLQTRQRAVAELDAKYTKELANAQSQIEVLRGDVAAGKRRLQLNATCTPVRDATGTGGMGNAPAPTVTADVERDYFSLRAGIESVTKQVGYLQEYINTQCLR